MKVHRDQKVFTIRLQNKKSQLLEEHGMCEEKSDKAPMDPSYVKSEDNSALQKDIAKYRSVVGSILYHSVVARLDIANSMTVLGKKVYCTHGARLGGGNDETNCRSTSGFAFMFSGRMIL